MSIFGTIKNVGKSILGAYQTYNDVKQKVADKGAGLLKDTIAKGIANVISPTPISGMDKQSTGLTTQDFKKAKEISGSGIGTPKFESTLRGAYTSKDPSMFADVLSIKSVGKPLVKEAVKKAVTIGKDIYQSIAESKSSSSIANNLSRLGIEEKAKNILSKQLTKIEDPERIRTILKNWLPEPKVNVYKDPTGYAIPKIPDVQKTPRESVGFQTYQVMKEPTLEKNLAQNSEAGFARLPSKEEVRDASLNARTQLVDRLAPIHDLVNNKGLTADQNPYIAARNFAGNYGKVQNRLDELSNILRPAKADLPDAKQYALLERYDELSNRGITKLPGGITPEQVKLQKAELEKKLGDRLPQAQAIGEQLRGFSDNLLIEARDAGIVSDEAYNTIKANNEKYVPLQRLEYLADQADNIPRGSNSFNVSSQSLVKSIKGSEKEVADPIESIIRNTYKTVNLIERNKVAQKVADLSNLPGFKDVVIPLRTADSVNARIDLYTEAKELKPLQNQVDRLLKSRSREFRSLQTELRNLNKEGLKISLRKQVTELPKTPVSKVKITIKSEELIENAPNSFDGLSNNYAVKDKLQKEFKNFELLKQEVKTGGYSRLEEIGINKATAESVAKQIFKKPTYHPLAVNATDVAFAIPQTNDVKKFINALITEPNINLDRIKSKIATRENKLGGLIDVLQTLRKNFDDLKTYRKELFQEARQYQDAEVPSGMEKLSVFRNGIKEEYAVPKIVGDALKGLNEESIDIITKTASLSSRALRAGATSLNLAFLPSNAIRDFQTATLVSKVGFTPLDWLKGFTEAIRRGDDYKAFLESGASSGYFSNQNVSKTVKELTESKGVKIAKTILNPVKLLETVGETIELAPRLGVFKRSMKQGLSTTESAFNAREATVDFAKAGSKLKVANMWVPFLNARLQGTINTLKAVKNNPVRSAMVIGAMVELPAIATYFHNTRQHPEIWDSIDQYEKDNNFIIIYGDEKDKDGNPTQVVRIPKGDVGKVYGNPTEEFLKYLDGKDPKKVGQLITEVFSNISPVDFAKNGEFSGQAVAGGILPPTIKAGVESATNTNLFTGRDIVPQNLQNVSPELQYKDSTPKSMVKLGQFLGVSPLQLENFVGTQFGGLGRQVIDPLKAPTMIGGRFSGARGGEQEQKDFNALNKVEQEVADSKLTTKRKAQEVFDRVKSLPVTERGEKIKDLMQRKEIDQNVLKEIGTIIEEQAKGLSSFEKSFKSQPNQVKAKFLVEKLNTLPKEDRAIYFKNLIEKKLVSKDVMKEITNEIKSKASQTSSQ